MNVTDYRGHLPLVFERSFRLWAYQLGHRQLEMRSANQAAIAGTLYVVFVDVLGMQVRDWYARLIVTEAADSAEIDRFVSIPERYSSRYMRLAVGDGTNDGFVVCGALDLRSEPSVSQPPPTSEAA